jgi:hypothetical protein
MNPALAFMPKFFVITGSILVLSGLGTWFVRARKDNETVPEMLASRATLKMVVFVAVGVAGVLLGLGVIPFPHFRAG